MWQYVDANPASQAPTLWHVDLREDPTTTPSQQPASLHGAACLVGLDACRSEAEPVLPYLVVLALDMYLLYHIGGLPL